MDNQEWINDIFIMSNDDIKDKLRERNIDYNIEEERRTLISKLFNYVTQFDKIDSNTSNDINTYWNTSNELISQQNKEYLQSLEEDMALNCKRYYKDKDNNSLDWTHHIIDDEPSLTKDTITIKFRLPNGTTQQRRFMKNTSFQYYHDYLQVQLQSNKLLYLYIGNESQPINLQKSAIDYLLEGKILISSRFQDT
jgi:hypothetical protein